MFDSVVGEIDAYEIGDACVLYGIEFNEQGRTPGKVIAFISSEEVCNNSSPLLGKRSCYRSLSLQSLKSPVSGPQLEVLQSLEPKPAQAFILSEKTAARLNCH